MKHKNWFNLLIMLGLLLLSTGVLSPAAPRPARAETMDGTIWHVIKGGTGANDCSSWMDACELQTALMDGDAGDQIWVATGVYTPGITVTDTFHLLDGVAIFGGFDPASGADEFGERDWEAFPTVLSGDIGGDDSTDVNGVITTTANITGTNSFHVVTGSGVTTTAMLDGFTITAGNAISTTVPNNRGGGMSIDGSNPTLNNLIFSGNSANSSGGGMYNQNGSPTLTNVTFFGNSAPSGGGMHNSNSSPTLTNVTFSVNGGGNIGGGIYNTSSSPILTNVTFNDNSADQGGGMHNDPNSKPTLKDVTFSGNFADEGGGIYNTSSPTLTNVTFSGNNASVYGGGMYTEISSPTLINVTFSGNSAGDSGGGMYNSDNSSPSVRNSILWNNLDSSGTGTITASIYNITSTITLTHSLVQGSGGSDSWVGGSYVDGGNNLDSDPLFVQAVDPDEAPTTGGDLRLQTGSPAINAGYNQYVSGIDTDLDGELRISGGTVDMGAYEYQCPSAATQHVDQAASPTGDGSSWENAYTDMQDALFVSAACSDINEIWVATGVYTPGITDIDTFQLLDGVAIFGGFDPASGADEFGDRDWEAFPTVLSGDIDGDDITDVNGVVTTTTNIVGDNSYHVVTGSGVTTTAVLDGFIITAGKANYGIGIPVPELVHNYGAGMINVSGYPALTDVTFSGNSANSGGGGMYNEIGSSPVLTNVNFVNNSATDGAGMMNLSSSPTLTGVTFSSNKASFYGGGIYNYINSNPTLTNVAFNGNSAFRVGGAIYNNNNCSPVLNNVTFNGNTSFSGGGMYNFDNSNPTLTNVSFNGNSASDSGGGMFNASSSPTLTNVIFSGNSSDLGGGMDNYSSSPVLTNVTFSGNSASIGGGMYNYANSSPNVRNSILWNNQDRSGTVTITATIVLVDSSWITLTHSLVQGSGGSDSWVGGSYMDGGNNIDIDPLFVQAVDPAEAHTQSGDLRLWTGSPAIDVGDNQYVTGIATDIDGKPRIIDGDGDGDAIVDMGAYEYEDKWIVLFLPLIPHQ